jgi:OFA family oxalate/formate antiporter-like MFS transporter
MNYDSKRWLFLCLCIIANACAGICYAWSVFQKPLVNQFNWPAADISLSFTLMLSMGAFLPVIVGKAQDYVQPRQVLVFGGMLFGSGLIGLSYVDSLTGLYIFSIMTGLGLSTIYPGGTVSNIVRFFPDKRGLAAGLLTAGASLGAVVWAPATVTLIEKYGILATFRLLGIAFLVIVCICGVFVEAAPKDYRPRGMASVASIGQVVGNVDLNWLGMLKNPLFYMVAGVFLAGEISGMMIIGYVSPIAQDTLKVSPQAAAGIVGLLAIANTAGRMCWGWVSDKIGRFAVVYILLTLGALAMAGLAMVNNYYSFICMIMAIGLCYGGYLALMAPLTTDLFGSKHLGVNFGIMFFTVGIAAFVGPRLAAVIKAASNDYTQAFIIAALLNVVGIVLTTIALQYRKSKNKTFAGQEYHLSDVTRHG